MARGRSSEDDRLVGTPGAVAPDGPPVPHSMRRGGPGGIRRTWWGVMAMFTLLLVVIATCSFAAMRFQRNVFERTTTRFRDTVGVLTGLQHEIIEAQIPLGRVIYELPEGGGLEAHWRQWTERRSAIEERLARLRALSRGPERPALDDAHEAWRRVVAGVDTGRSMWGTGEANAALARGADPFADTVWAPLRSVQKTLARLSVEGVSFVQAEAQRAELAQARLEPLLTAVIAVAVALGLLVGWRLSRRVVRPLVELRASAARIRDGNLSEPVRPPPGARGEVAELAASMQEMAQALQKSHGRLLEQAHTDGLTGLANRRALGEALDHALAGADRDDVALLLVDLDDFKSVNDSMGHAVGDALLTVVARRLKSAARATDTVARLGGDEFALVVRAENATAAARSLAERVLVAMRDLVELSTTAVRVRASIGIAVSGDRGLTADDLIRNADMAMYVAKSRGRDRYEYFDPTMERATLSRIELKEDLAQAVACEELQLHYQPIVDLASDEIVGFEALLRWDHPRRGVVPPVELIPVAEETGDIVAIGQWVLDRACRELAVLQAASRRGRWLWVAVNASSRQLLAPGFVDDVRGALAGHAVGPDALVLELTEAQLVTDTALARRVLGDLRAAGVRVAIDNFGTGFSSLRYLHELPVDIIKIDRSFICGAADDADRRFVLGSIVSIGRGLGLELVAEGIERPSERTCVRELGPVAGQGDLLGRPTSATEAIGLLQAEVIAVQTVRTP